MKKAPRKMTKMILSSVVGQKMIDVGTQASGGIGRRISRGGNQRYRNVRLIAIKSPTGIPMSCASANPDRTREKLAIQSFQNLLFPTIWSSEAEDLGGRGNRGKKRKMQSPADLPEQQKPENGDEAAPKAQSGAVFSECCSRHDSGKLPFAGLKCPYGFLAHGLENLDS